MSTALYPAKFYNAKLLLNLAINASNSRVFAVGPLAPIPLAVVLVVELLPADVILLLLHQDKIVYIYIYVYFKVFEPDEILALRE